MAGCTSLGAPLPHEIGPFYVDDAAPIPVNEPGPDPAPFKAGDQVETGIVRLFARLHSFAELATPILR
jgi:hypothetical protein